MGRQLQLLAQSNLSNQEATLFIVRKWKGRLKIKQPKKFKNRRNVQISSDALGVAESLRISTSTFAVSESSAKTLRHSDQEKRRGCESTMATPEAVHGRTARLTLSESI